MTNETKNDGFNDAQREAVAMADAYLSNAGLPTFTRICEMLAESRDALGVEDSEEDTEPGAHPAVRLFGSTAELLPTSAPHKPCELYGFQLKNGAFGLVFTTDEETAANTIREEYAEEAEIIDAADLVVSQYNGLAFLTTESE